MIAHLMIAHLMVAHLMVAHLLVAHLMVVRIMIAGLMIARLADWLATLACETSRFPRFAPRRGSCGWRSTPRHRLRS